MLSARLVLPSPLMRELPRFERLSFLACGLRVVVVIAACGCHTGAVHPRIVILNSVVSANQTMVSVVAAVGHLLTGIFVLVPAAVRPEISIRVIGAVRAIVCVFARLVVTVGVKGAVVAIPSMIL